MEGNRFEVFIRTPLREDADRELNVGKPWARVRRAELMQAWYCA